MASSCSMARSHAASRRQLPFLVVVEDFEAFEGATKDEPQIRAGDSELRADFVLVPFLDEDGDQDLCVSGRLHLLQSPPDQLAPFCAEERLLAVEIGGTDVEAARIEWVELRILADDLAGDVARDPENVGAETLGRLDLAGAQIDQDPLDRLLDDVLDRRPLITALPPFGAQSTPEVVVEVTHRLRVSFTKTPQILRVERVAVHVRSPSGGNLNEVADYGVAAAGISIPLLWNGVHVSYLMEVVTQSTKTFEREVARCCAGLPGRARTCDPQLRR